jgi:hypothetical protein
MDRFIARENIRHFRDRLWSESDPDTRLRLHRLLLAEEDKLAADLDSLPILSGILLMAMDVSSGSKASSLICVSTVTEVFRWRKLYSME